LPILQAFSYALFFYIDLLIVSLAVSSMMIFRADLFLVTINLNNVRLHESQMPFSFSEAKAATPDLPQNMHSPMLTAPFLHPNFMSLLDCFRYPVSLIDRH